MIELNIPGLGRIELEHLACELNAALALDGKLQEGLVCGLPTFNDRPRLHLLTADTHSNQEIIDRQRNLEAVWVQPGKEALQKADFIRELDAERVVALGHGANDTQMLKEAAWGSANFLSKERRWKLTKQLT